MLFYLILHVIQFSGFNCRCQNSAGKSTHQDTLLPDAQKLQKIQKFKFFRNKRWSQNMGRRRRPKIGAAYSRRSTMGRGQEPPLAPVALLRHPFGALPPIELKTSGVSTNKFSAGSTRRKPDREKKSSGREKSAGEFPSRRGGIAVIVITITPGIIGIIINIISTISTIITATIPSHLAVTIVVVLLLVHRNRISGVDYHL